MASSSQPGARTDHNFSGPTFCVIVGQGPSNVKQFTLHANMFTKQSEFFRAAREPKWLTGDPDKPVDLTHEDPVPFQTYSKCVYCGPEAFREDEEAFELAVHNGSGGYNDLKVDNLASSINKQTIRNVFSGFGKINNCDVHENVTAGTRVTTSQSSRSATIGFTNACTARAARKALDGQCIDGHEITVEFVPADMLQDVTTVNMIIDAVDALFRLTEVHPGPEPMTFVYEPLSEADPFRLFLHGLWIHETDERYCPERLKYEEFPYAMLQGLAVLYENNAKQARSCIDCEDTPDIGETRMCNYHQHDTEHPICSSDPKKCVVALELEESDYAMSTE